MPRSLPRPGLDLMVGTCSFLVLGKLLCSLTSRTGGVLVDRREVAAAMNERKLGTCGSAAMGVLMDLGIYRWRTHLELKDHPALRFPGAVGTLPKSAGGAGGGPMC